MKKKIITLLLVFCLAICFVGCGKSTTDKNDGNENSTPAQSDVVSVNDAVKKTQELDSVDATLKMEMKMSEDGMDITIPIVADIKAKALKSDSPIISTVMTMSMMGEELEMEMYQENDWVYIAEGGTGYKMSAADMGSDYDYAGDMKDMLKTLPDDLVKSAKSEKAEDGSTTYTIDVSGEKFTEIYADFLSDVNEDSGMTGEDVKISDVIIKITTANGYVSVYEMNFIMDVTIDEVASKFDVNASITYNNLGKEVTVTPPDGYQDFEELGGFDDYEDYEDLEDFEF